MHMHINLYTYKHIYAYMYLYTYIYIYIYVSTFIHIHTFIHIYTHICTFCRTIYTYAHVYIHMHTYIYTYMKKNCSPHSWKKMAVLIRGGKKSHSQSPIVKVSSLLVVLYQMAIQLHVENDPDLGSRNGISQKLSQKSEL